MMEISIMIAEFRMNSADHNGDFCIFRIKYDDNYPNVVRLFLKSRSKQHYLGVVVMDMRKTRHPSEVSNDGLR